MAEETPMFPVMLPTSEKHGSFRNNFLCVICNTLHLICSLLTEL